MKKPNKYLSIKNEIVNRKLLIIIFLLNVLPFVLISQNQKLDSLFYVLKIEKDTQKIKTQYKIAMEYEMVLDFNNATAFTQAGLIESEKLQFEKGIFIGLYNMGHIKFNQMKSQESIRFLYKALNLGSKLNNIKSIGLCYFGLGQNYSFSNQDSALYFYQKSIDVLNNSEYQQELSDNFIDIANIYDAKGNLNLAIDYYIKGLSIAEKLNNRLQMGMYYGSIANVFNRIKNYDKAIVYYQKIISNSIEMKDTISLIIGLNNLGIVYQYQGKYNIAVNYQTKALTLAQSNNQFKFYEANSLGNLGSSLSSLNKLDEALKNLIKAKYLFKDMRDGEGLSTVVGSIGEIYNKKKNYSIAIKYYLECEQLLDSLKDNFELKNCYYSLSELYEKIHDPNKALSYYKNYSTLKDSLFNEEKSQQAFNMLAKYETNKKDEEINSLKKDQKINALLLEDQKNKNLILIISVVLIIVLSIFLYNRFKLKQKIVLNEVLANEKEKRINLIIETTELERKKIAKELHDSVGSLMATAKLNIENLRIKNKNTDLELSNTAALIDKAASEVRTVSYQMSSKVLLYFGLAAAIKELFENTLLVIGVDAKLESNDSIRYEKDVELCLYRVIQEAVSNIIKHAKASKVLIQITETDNNLVMLIEDNGKGINLQADKLGLGIENMKSRVNAVNGQFDIVNVGNGTSIHLKIPINLGHK